MLGLTNTNPSQLSVFDYQVIAKHYGDNTATRLEGIEYHIRGVSTKAAIEIGNKLIEAKGLVKYGDFTEWHINALGFKSQRVSDFMRIAEAYATSPETGEVFPTKLRPASTMAKAILETSGDKRGGLVEEFKEKTQEKGKSLTEKEIKELAKKYLDEKDKQIKELKQKEINLTGELTKEQTENDKLKGQVNYYDRVWKDQIETISKLKEENKQLEDIEIQKDRLKKREADIKRSQQEAEEITTRLKRIENFMQGLSGFNAMLDNATVHVIETTRVLVDDDTIAQIYNTTDLEEITRQYIEQQLTKFYDYSQTLVDLIENIKNNLKQFDHLPQNHVINTKVVQLVD